MEKDIAYIPISNKRFKETRWTEIERIIASGKAVRFNYGPFHKDVKSLEGEDIPQDPGVEPHFDLIAFRQSGGRTDHVAWESSELSIEEVDI